MIASKRGLVRGVVGPHRNALTEYDRAWLDYRLAFIHADVDATMTAIRTIDRLSPPSKGTYDHAVAAFFRRALRTKHYTRSIVSSRIEAPCAGLPRIGVSTAASSTSSEYDREQALGVAARAAFPDRLSVFPALLRAAATRWRRGDRGLIKQAKAVPPDPYIWDLGLLLAETTDELRAHGTVHVEFPRWIELLLNNIMEHTAHHVDPKVPLYHLTKAQDAIEATFGRENVINERFSFAGMSATFHTCQLYDFANHRWLTFDGQPTTQAR